MKALVLAAGLGNRLGELTQDKPKALVKVGNLELIKHVLNFLDNPKISDIAVVTGYKSDLLSSFIKNASDKIKIFFNPNFKLGSIKTIECALPFLDDDFLLSNVDHIYPKQILERVLNNASEITAICDFDRNLVDDDMKIKLNTSGHLKKISKTLADFDGGYIGMTYCSKTHLKIYHDAIKAVIKDSGELSSVESILDTLAQNGEKINICDASNIGWLEVDTEEDLKKAEHRLLTERIF